MERLGFGYDDLGRINPRIVYAFGTGFGLDGPYAHKGGRDVLAQAMSGAMHRRADPALPLSIYPTTLADYAAGMHLVQGILLALMQREKTGEGQRVAVTHGGERRRPCRPRPAGRGRRAHGPRPPGRDGDPRGTGSPAAPPRSRPRLLRGREPPRGRYRPLLSCRPSVRPDGSVPGAHDALAPPIVTWLITYPPHRSSERRIAVCYVDSTRFRRAGGIVCGR